MMMMEGMPGPNESGSSSNFFDNLSPLCQLIFLVFAVGFFGYALCDISSLAPPFFVVFSIYTTIGLFMLMTHLTGMVYKWYRNLPRSGIVGSILGLSAFFCGIFASALPLGYYATFAFFAIFLHDTFADHITLARYVSMLAFLLLPLMVVVIVCVFDESEDMLEPS